MATEMRHAPSIRLTPVERSIDCGAYRMKGGIPIKLLSRHVARHEQDMGNACICEFYATEFAEPLVL
jgi:hypothetical protein